MSDIIDMDRQMDLLRQLLEDEKMSQFRTLWLDWHLYDQGQFYLTLDKELRDRLYTYLSPKEMADMLDVVEEDHQDIKEYIAEMHPEYVASILTEMFTDNAVDILSQLEKKDIRNYLSLMDVDTARELKELLHYEDKTAGSIMATEYVSIYANQTVQSALAILKEEAKEAEIIYYVYVVSKENKLVGVLSLRDLIVSDYDQMISDVMSERIMFVDVDDDQQDVAQVFRDYDLLAIPVTDYNQQLVGIITVDDIIDVIDDEATSDYSGLAGVDVDEMTESPIKAASKRLPWLITLLFLGMSTATLISNYEELISEASILAVFISLITGTAGNAGTQSLAVAVRRLAVTDEENINISRLVLTEVLTGLLTGFVTGVVIFLVVGFWKQNFILGFVIGVAMMCAITVANLAGSIIPMLMEKLGFDPAVASGPFITTLSDLTSVLIYFNIAKLFLSFFTGTQ